MTELKQEVYEIELRDPQSILQEYLGNDVHIVNFECEPLVKTGENYGSTIMKVCIKITRGNGIKEEEKLNLVAKMLPPTVHQRKIFESGFTFKKEIFLYKNLIPIYKSFLPGENFDVVPKFYGARFTMKFEIDEVDDDAVIFMENLKNKGYYMVDKRKGLDKTHLKVAIEALAKFHAIGLLIKCKKLDYLPILKKYGHPMNMNDEIMIKFLTNTMNCLRENSYTEGFVDRILSTITGKISECYYTPLELENKWTCIVHGDVWSNNVLFHRNEAGNADDAKIVDFQTFYLASPLNDLIFFLFTSMELPFEHFDEALEMYRQTVINILERLDCSVDLFSRKNFEERLKIDARNELVHVTLMSKIIDLKEDEVFDEGHLTEAFLIRITRILDIYTKKKWI